LALIGAAVLVWSAEIAGSVTFCSLATAPIESDPELEMSYRPNEILPFDTEDCADGVERPPHAADTRQRDTTQRNKILILISSGMVRHHAQKNVPPEAYLRDILYPDH